MVDNSDIKSKFKFSKKIFLGLVEESHNYTFKDLKVIISKKEIAFSQ